jgi:hypothetical protein
MNRTTLIMVVLAAGSVGWAYSKRPQELAAAQYEDTGDALFPDFTDPSLATSLAVVAYDEESAAPVEFSVKQKDGRWVIPSHEDYPADGTERMAKAAASFIDVKKDLYYGDKAEDHAAFGVLDPQSTEGDGTAKGQRITIEDASGTVLVDVIVGKAIPEKQGWYYVRKPEEKRVYGTRLELDISTSFADWIEKDLLHVERDEFVEMIYSPYTVDEKEGKVIGADKPIHAVVDPASGDKKDWILGEGSTAPDGKALDSMKVRQMLTALASLKIVGVRPRPQPRSLLEARLQLQEKGFFIAADPQQPVIYGNEGQLTAFTEDGVAYTVFFGEVTYETGIALSAGKEGEAPAEDEPPSPEVKPEGEAEDTSRKASRYIFVNVSYDPSKDKTLAEGGASEDPAADPAADDKGQGGEEDAANKKKSAERAQALAERFDTWFYVIADTSFTQIHKNTDELFKDAKKDEGGAPDPGDMGGMGGMGLPPGM